MSKFRDALQKGKEAHEDAERAKREIRDLFAALTADVLESTNEQVKIVYGTLTRRKYTTDSLGLFKFPNFDIERYTALYIRSPTGGDADELCTIRLSQHGYPVTIEYPGNSTTALDRQSLEDSLVEMLENPDIAGKISRATAENQRIGTEQPKAPDGER